MLDFETIDFGFDWATFLSIGFAIIAFLWGMRFENRKKLQNERVIRVEGVLAKFRNEHILPFNSITYKEAYKKTDIDKLFPMLEVARYFLNNEVLPILFVFSTKDNIQAVREIMRETGNLYSNCKIEELKYKIEELKYKKSKVKKTEKEERAKFLRPNLENSEIEDEFNDQLRYGMDWDDMEKMKEYLSYEYNEKMKDMIKTYIKKILELEKNIIISLRIQIHDESESDSEEITELYRRPIS